MLLALQEARVTKGPSVISLRTQVNPIFAGLKPFSLEHSRSKSPVRLQDAKMEGVPEVL